MRQVASVCRAEYGKNAARAQAFWRGDATTLKVKAEGLAKEKWNVRAVLERARFCCSTHAGKSIRAGFCASQAQSNNTNAVSAIYHLPLRRCAI